MSSAVRTLLSRHRRALQRREAARLLLWASGGLPWLVLLLGLLAELSPAAARLFAAVLLPAGFGWLAFTLRGIPRPLALAGRLEQRDASLQGLLTAGLEFREARPQESTALREEALRRADQLAAGLRLPLPALAWRPPLRTLLVGLCSLGLLALAFPRAMVDAALFAPAALADPAILRVRVSPPTLIEGESVEVQGIALGRAAPDTVQLGLRAGGGSWQWRSLRRRAGNRYGTELPWIWEDTEILLQAPGFAADTTAVQVQARPRLRELELEATPPAHTGLEPVRSVADLVIPGGSTIDLRGTANVPLRAATLRFAGGDSLPCRVAGDRLEASWLAASDTTWWLDLVDPAGNPPTPPRRHRVRVLPDLPPRVELLSPAHDLDLDEAMQVALEWRASDDYGLTMLELAHRMEKGSPVTQVLRAKLGSREIQGGWTWDLASLDLLPGDAVELWIRARDNHPQGQWGESQHRWIRFPSIAEIYAEVSGHGEEGVMLAQELSEAFEEMGETLRSIREGAEREGGQLSWGARAELEGLQIRAEELRGAVEQMQTQLEAEAQSRAPGLATAVAEKLEEVHRLMEEVLDEELRELMESLRQALEGVEPVELDESLASAQQRDEEILRNLERTAAILERLRQEQALEQAIAMAEELGEREARVAEQIEGNAHEAAAQAQEEANRAMKDLAAHLDEAPESGLETDLKEALEEAAEAALGTVPQARAGRIPRDLRNANTDRAQTDLGHLRSGFESLHAQLKDMQDRHMQRMKGQVADALERQIQRLAELSQAAERNHDEEPEVAAVGQNQAARHLRAATRELEQLERQSLFVTPQVRGLLLLASGDLESSGRELAAGRGELGRRAGQRGMARINEAAARLLQGLAALQQASSSSGYGEALEKLAQAARAQAELLGQGQLLPLPGGEIPAPGPSLREMAREQKRIRELVAEARRSLGGGLGNLRAIEESMEEVERALLSGAPPESIRRQEQTILNRLLDAQRSVRKQGTAKRREAQVARSYRWEPDPEGAADVRPTPPLLDRGAILEALDDHYPASYEEEIRAYFEALAARGGRP